MVASSLVDLPLVGEEGDGGGCGGGEALNAPLQVALLSMQSGGKWNGMESLVIK
jgi:hypothetical protein